MKKESKKTTDTQLLELLRQVLPKATTDPKLAGLIYSAVEQELKSKNRAVSFVKFCQRVELPDLPDKPDVEDERLLALDAALCGLAAEDPIAARVIELRHFAGLSIEDAAAALGISRATAYRHWTYARAWLKDAVAGADPG